MRPRIAALFLLPMMVAAGCELRQVTVAEPEDLVVAEVYLRVTDGRPDAFAILHRTFGPGAAPPPEAVLHLRSEGGEEAWFAPAPLEECLDGEIPEGIQPACHRLTGEEAAPIRPGARLRVTVELAGGGRLEGGTVVPGDFHILLPQGLPREGEGQGRCLLPPVTPFPLTWTASRGVWAYLPEVELRGLRKAFAPAGLEVRNEPLALLGLSISEADTTIAFPGGFGLFNRFSGDREVLVALQAGLPPGEVEGEVVVSAVDRNTTNWSRGGNFNPSGQIRVPSLFGDGTGVVGSVVNRGFSFQVGGAPGDPAVCGGEPPL